ncbi:phytoene desaturase family protein [Cytophagaceae bacterium DM2B3-1]|uniref:Phytoene desaturase family protein n=1 Tax=Xanthocytophaga flava TaxID=3048013 RepID=A0AAE3QU59_9BACT|nr:1-hydroxycarotenoid 3,4-desaturase CrtD [Xanthocytophaga flavus]MDJ1483433.1 phytoene desaturase family protein [Xanthocytophaga flavus]MDJ1495758.1 phytoene desaturase family protein [Xanthocytophaga flavus]
MSRKTVAIIGSGIAGIATAIRLAAKGFRVTIFEANSSPGGKLSEFELEGYRFDAGPSLFTMPHFVEELFLIAGKNPADYIAYGKLPVICEYFYEDGTHIRAYSDPEKFAEEIEQKTGQSKKSVLSYLKQSAFKYEVTANLFLKRSLHKLSTWLNLDAIRGYWNLPKLDVFQTLNEVNERHFQDPRIVQLFNRYATYNGSNPYETPGIMHIIPHLEYNVGAFFPAKGMYNITQSLVRLAEDMGVLFCYNTRINEIVVLNNKAVGVRPNKIDGRPAPTYESFDVVVSNMDIVNTYRKLLPHVAAPTRILEQPKSSSALIFYWGITRSFFELDLHNIFFSKDYQHEFDCLFHKQTISNDPTIYINITSKYKPDDAPSGCENWFTMINVPNNSGQDWDGLIDEARRNIILKLSRILKTDISKLIACEYIQDPRTIEARTSSSQGALYGISSNNRYAAFLRHDNKSSKVKNLYFVGGSVHPGGGIPLSLLSAKIAAGMVKDPV